MGLSRSLARQDGEMGPGLVRRRIAGGRPRIIKRALDEIAGLVQAELA